MLSLLGRPSRMCDGVSRREFLRIGGLALGGMSMTDIFRAEAQAGRTASKKAIIMIFLSGGPPHQDMVDLKPDAPAEVRGEFSPIDTNLPGFQICELFPRMSRMMDKFAVIRSLVGSEGRHAAFQCQTGWPVSNQPQGGWPSLGSATARLLGPAHPQVPAFVGLAPKMITSTWADPGQPGFLGQAYAPFKPSAEGQADMVLNGISLDRLDNRQSLLAQVDRFRREVDAKGVMDGMDAATQQAFGVLTSSRLANALDLEKEDRAVRDRYGYGDPKPAGYGDAGPLLNTYLLTARRLVEAGVRCVTLAYGRWDWHGRPHGTCFEHSRIHFPMLDQGLTALVEDLHQRGLADDVSVVCWGEFGRTPRSTTTLAVTTGRRSPVACWPAAECGRARSSARPTGWPSTPKIVRSTSRKSSLRSITASASTFRRQRSRTSTAVRSTWSTTCCRCASWCSAMELCSIRAVQRERNKFHSTVGQSDCLGLAVEAVRMSVVAPVSLAP